MKKYDFTGKTIDHNGITLKQIIRLSDNLVGGYIQHKSNLSQYGTCFVYHNAKVYGKGRVSGDAEMYGDTEVFERAIISNNVKVYGNAKVFGCAQVYGRATIADNSLIYGNVKIYGDAIIFCNSRVFDNAMVFDNAKIYGNAKVYGNSEIFDRASILGYAVVKDEAKISGGAYVGRECLVCENDVVTGKLLNFIDMCQFNITASKKDDYIRVGCVNHSVMEWLSYIESGESFYLEECVNEREYSKCIKAIQYIIDLMETVD